MMMNLRYPVLILLLCGFTQPSHAKETALSWFRTTPLQLTLNALVSNQPKLAWQELITTLDKHPLPYQYWQPIKEQILSQTDCGKQLTSTKKPATITLSIISRVTFSALDHQIKLSAEQITETASFELREPSENIILSGQLNPNLSYQEWETSDLLAKPETGIYTLTIGQNSYKVLISSYSTYQWLERSTNESSLLNSKPPQLTNQCPPMTVFQQWFDAEYRQVGTQHAIVSQTNQIQIPLQAVPEQAKFQRVSARIFEYQSDIKIEYLHRVAVPSR